MRQRLASIVPSGEDIGTRYVGGEGPLSARGIGTRYVGGEGPPLRRGLPIQGPLTGSDADGMLSGKSYGLIIRPYLRARHGKGE